MTFAVVILLLVMSLAALVGLPLTLALDHRCSLSARWIDPLLAGLFICGVFALTGWTGLGVAALVVAG